MNNSQDQEKATRLKEKPCPLGPNTDGPCIVCFSMTIETKLCYICCSLLMNIRCHNSEGKNRIEEVKKGNKAIAEGFFLKVFEEPLCSCCDI